MSDFPVVRLKPGKEQSVQRFHPWIFSGAIADQPGGLAEGDVVEVQDHREKYLATGHYQIGSIAVRMFDFGQAEVSHAFWLEKFRRALSVRRQAGLLDRPGHDMFRLVHGEGDGLPGLIVDVYGKVAVLQCHSIGFYRVRQTLAALIMEVLAGRVEAVYDKSAHTLPNKADIDPQDGYLLGETHPWQAQENGSHYLIDVVGGQKTGFFIDQRENRALVTQYAEGRDVLNTFCYTGGFSVAALRGGALRVDSVDSSQPAIELTRQNIALNGFDEQRHQAINADVFKYLKDIRDQYDLIVLDPPAFAKHRRVLSQALKGYRSINQRAFEQIRSGGLLFTFSCSQVVSRDDFRRSVFTAAALARREVRILHQLSQPADHPVNIYHPEGEYLKGLVLAVD
jgi:23S rRNA (cytosine1962-C5)-methyltransferase